MVIPTEIDYLLIALIIWFNEVVKIPTMTGNLGDLYEFNVASMCWRELIVDIASTVGPTTFPSPRNSIGMTAVAGRIIIYGGTTGDELSYSDLTKEPNRSQDQNSDYFHNLSYSEYRVLGSV